MIDLNEYYEKKAKDSAEQVACWCWMVAAIAVVACGVAVVKWLIAL